MSVVSSRLVQRFRVRELPHLFSSPTAPTTPKQVSNPFLPKLNPKSGKWAPPKYSLRRQANLIKEAKRAGELHLLPSGLKNLAQPTEVVAKHPKPSAILQLIQSTKSQTVSQKSEQVDETVEWVGEPKQRTTFGLYGKRQKMFKGRKWEKQVKLRKAYVKKVVEGLDSQKRNMRWGRQRRSKRPRTKYPI